MIIERLIQDEKGDVLANLPKFIDLLNVEHDLDQLAQWAINNDKISEVALIVNIYRPSIAIDFSEALATFSDDGAL